MVAHAAQCVCILPVVQHSALEFLEFLEVPNFGFDRWIMKCFAHTQMFCITPPPYQPSQLHPFEPSTLCDM